MSGPPYNVMLGRINDVDLERLVAFYINEYCDPEVPAVRIGRSGSAQDGVDVHARLKGVGDVGYQAKAYHTKRLTKEGIDKEVAQASEFEPPLKQYTIVTLNKRDATLQKHVRQCELHGVKCVSILFADDLVDLAVTHRKLSELLFDMAFTPAEVQSLVALADRRGVGTLTVAPVGFAKGLPSALRECEDWINNGRPALALQKLSEYQGDASRPLRRRIECRALVSLERFDEVMHQVAEEQTEQSPDADVLSIGVYAAYELGRTAEAEILAAAALGTNNDDAKISAAAAHIFLAAKMRTQTLAELERFAELTTGDSKKLARALGDAAVFLGESARGLYWHQVAEKSSPVRSLAAEINQACCTLLVRLDEKEAGCRNAKALKAAIRTLEELVKRSRYSEVPDFLFVLQNTLSFAYEAVEKYQNALRALDSALLLSEHREGLWIKRCLFCANGVAPVPGDEIAGRHLRTPASHLALAMAQTLAGAYDDAEATITRVLAQPDLTDDLRSVAFVERLRLDQARDASSIHQLAEGAIGYAEATNEPSHVLGWLLNAYPLLESVQQRRIQHAVEKIDLCGLRDDAVAAIGLRLVHLGLSRLCVDWRNRLAEIAFGGGDVIRNFEVARCVARICTGAFEFDRALELWRSLLKIRPKNAGLRLSYAKTYYAKGDRDAAYAVLVQAIRDGVVSARLLHGWSEMATTLGYHRSAQSLLRSLNIPASVTEDDFVHIMHVRSTLRVRASGEEVFQGLRRGLLTASNAGKFFDMARRSRAPKVAVADGHIVQIGLEGEAGRTFYVSSAGGDPVPGIDTYLESTHPWVRELYGAVVGDIVLLKSAPFEGRQVEVTGVWSPWAWMFRTAANVLSVADPVQTGMTTIKGSVDEQLEKTRQIVASSKERRTTSIGEHISRHMPIALLADARNTSARQFLTSNPEWKPTSGEGNLEMRRAEDFLLRKITTYVLDPVALLLVCALNIDGLLKRLPSKPKMSRQACWDLFDWYQLERQRLKAIGYLNVDERGNLVLVENSAKSRVAAVRYWRRVRNCVQDDVEIVDPPALNRVRHGGVNSSLVGAGIASEILVAKDDGALLVSEEYIVRALAESEAGCGTATLHGLILHAADNGWISKTKATMSLAGLIHFGWNWVSFGRWMIDHALRFDSPRREACVHAFLGRIKSAEPLAAVDTLVSILRALDKGGYPKVQDSWLRHAVIAALPPLNKSARTKIVDTYDTNMHSSRRVSATRRALGRWANFQD